MAKGKSFWDKPVDEVKDEIVETITEVTDTVDETKESVIDIIKDAAEEVKETIAEAAEEFKETIVEVVEEVKETIVEAVEEIQEVINDGVLIETIKVGDKIKGFPVTSVTSKIVDDVETIYVKVKKRACYNISAPKGTKVSK